MLFTMNRVETHLTWGIFTGAGAVCVGIFFAHNGFLLFKLNPIARSSPAKFYVALKRFFYFFIPAMLVSHFCVRIIKRGYSSVSTVAFGLLTYAIVGGTRANIITFLPFCLSASFAAGSARGMLAAAGVLGIVGMFWLALKRYAYETVSGDEAFYTSPLSDPRHLRRGEPGPAAAKLLTRLSFRDLSPSSGISMSLSPAGCAHGRPTMVLNTANYFTPDVLNNHSTAISPTLIGSLVVMGGVWFVPLGAVAVGLIIKMV